MPKPIAIDDAALERVTGGAHNTAATGNDTLIGGDGREGLGGGAGDDSISAGGGDDVISGGTGQDTIDAGAGDDWIHWRPGDGSDSIDGGTGRDTLFLPQTHSSEMVVTLSDGTVLQPSANFSDIDWGYHLPPGASGTITVGGVTIQFSNIERIMGSDMSAMMEN